MRIILIFSLFIITLFFPKNIDAYNNPYDNKNNIFGIGIANHSDLEDVAQLVNSNGGDWGYVTIVMTTDNLSKEMWQAFFDKCRKLHLIPIVRIATQFDGTNWIQPDINKIDQQVNFLNSLNWVIQNRYVIIGNEPNHAKEWGGVIDPDTYGTYLKTYSQRLKNSSSDYFVLPAGLDQDARNTKNTLDAEDFIRQMVNSHADIFEYIDGINSHAYPNPAFSGSPEDIGRRSVRGYEWELGLIRSFGITKNLPVFITETGWINNGSSEENLAENLSYVFENVWKKDPQIIAVTPFILNYTQEPFSKFSWKKQDGSFYKYYEEINKLPKVTGEPKQKVQGEVLFSFLNPFGFTGTRTKGYFLAKNTGQNVWDEKNIVILEINEGELSTDTINLDQIIPFKNGLVSYSLQLPDTPENKEIRLGLYISGIYIDDVYNDRIISFSKPAQKEQKLSIYKTWMKGFRNMFNI